MLEVRKFICGHANQHTTTSKFANQHTTTSKLVNDKLSSIEQFANSTKFVSQTDIFEYTNLVEADYVLVLHMYYFYLSKI
jgi:hypothetical protein